MRESEVSKNVLRYFSMFALSFKRLCVMHLLHKEKVEDIKSHITSYAHTFDYRIKYNLHLKCYVTLFNIKGWIESSILQIRSKTSSRSFDSATRRKSSETCHLRPSRSFVFRFSRNFTKGNFFLINMQSLISVMKNNNFSIISEYS